MSTLLATSYADIRISLDPIRNTELAMHGIISCNQWLLFWLPISLAVCSKMKSFRFNSPTCAIRAACSTCTSRCIAQLFLDRLWLSRNWSVCFGNSDPARPDPCTHHRAPQVHPNLFLVFFLFKHVNPSVCFIASASCLKASWYFHSDRGLKPECTTGDHQGLKGPQLSTNEPPQKDTKTPTEV
jgi:hypothetical protein